jgi:hypothetical protein
MVLRITDFLREMIILAVLLDVENQYFIRNHWFKVTILLSVLMINNVITERPHSLTSFPVLTK